MEHRGRVLSRDLLLTDVWGYSYTGGTRTVDVHVRRLREKVPFLADAIVTVKQFGYKLDGTCAAREHWDVALCASTSVYDLRGFRRRFPALLFVG